jgi:hypothetical protein
VDYLEVFCNQRRRHSTLGQVSLAEYEGQCYARSHVVNMQPETETIG